VFFWMGVVAPSGTPEAVTQKLANEIRAILNLPDIRDRLTKTGFAISPGTPGEMLSTMKADHQKWGAVVKAAKITAE